MTQLLRTLGGRTTIAMVIGGIIGSGIFMKPSLMLQQLGSPVLLLTVWVVAGCITLFGALSNAEVAALFPETGGQYVFFEKMYGRGFAFLYGWAAFAVFNTAGNASIAYVCSEYTNYFVQLPRFDPATEGSLALYIPFIGRIFPLANIGVKVLTIAIIAVLTVINYRSVQSGGALQRVLTAMKAIALLLLVGGVLGSGKGDLAHLTETVTRTAGGAGGAGGVSAAGAAPVMGPLAAYMAALAGAFWAYDGWNNITFIAGEVKDPQRNIPRSLLVGLSACILVYVLVNLAFIYALPPDQMAFSSFVAADAASVTWGAIGGSVIALLVIVSTFGTVNANVLSTSRVTFAMGQDNRLFAWAGNVHPRFRTPGNALLLNAGWTALMVLSGSFDMLTDMLIFVSWFFYGMSALGLFLLRRKYASLPRPFRVPFYPVLPAIFVLFTAFFLVITLYQDVVNYQAGVVPVVNSLLGVLITLVGWPLYRCLTRVRGTS